MKLILIRHGESARNVGLKAKGEENSLTIKGVKQAVDLGAKLVSRKIESIYCSPTARCIQTMDEILRIRDDGMPIHLSKLIGPKTNQETLEKLKSRVELFIDDLQYDHMEGDTVIVISHKMPISMMHFLIKEERRELENGEIVEVELKVKEI